MKRYVVMALLMLACLGWAASVHALQFGPFGEVLIRGQEKNPSGVVLLISDSPGWGAVEEEMAKIAGSEGALVLGVDCKKYFELVRQKNNEPNVSNELDQMSTFAQKNLGIPTLMQPLLMGYGHGAGIAYASLVQAPARVFSGAISLGFRPEIPLTQVFGWGRGLQWTKTATGVRYEPFTKISLPWTVIQAENDPVLPLSAVRLYVKGMAGVSVHTLSGMSGYDRVASWMPLVREQVRAHRIAPAAPVAEDHADIGDLPLVEVLPVGKSGDTLAVFVSGDGGWAGIDKDIAAILAKNGIAVVGLDSLRYFWTKRTPEGGGADLERIIRHYLAAWNMKRVMLIGFSLGADALPPMAATLPPDLRKIVRQVTLLAPSKKVELEFHVTDWLSDDEESQDIDLLPEVRKLEPVPMLCVYGEDEESSLCQDLRPDEATIKSLPGSHHFNGEFAKVAELMLAHLKDKAP